MYSRLRTVVELAAAGTARLACGRIHAGLWRVDCGGRERVVMTEPNKEGVRITPELVEKLKAAKSSQEFMEKVNEEIQTFCGDAPQADDITMIVLQKEI